MCACVYVSINLELEYSSHRWWQEKYGSSNATEIIYYHIFFPTFHLLFSFGIQCLVLDDLFQLRVCSNRLHKDLQMWARSAFSGSDGFFLRTCNSQIYNLQFPCAMLYFAQRFNHIEFVSIWLFDILFERVCGIRSRCRVQIIRSLVKYTTNFSSRSFHHLAMRSVVLEFVSLVVCISFIRSWFCRLRAHFVFIVGYVFWFGLAWLGLCQTCIFCEQQECERGQNAFWYSLAACSISCNITCFSNSHIVNKFGFILFEILFSISHVFKNQCFFFVTFSLMRCKGASGICYQVWSQHHRIFFLQKFG